MSHQNLALIKEIPYDQKQVNDMIKKIQEHFLLNSSRKIKKLQKDEKQKVMRAVRFYFSKKNPPNFLNPNKFFLSKCDIYLSLYDPEISGLGDFPLSPFTYTNKVIKIEHKKNQGIVLIDMEKIWFDCQLDLEQLIEIFNKMGNQEYKQTAMNLQWIKDIFSQDFSQFLQPKPFQNKILEEFFSDGKEVCFSGFIVKINADGTFVLENIIASEKLLDYIDYVMNSKLVPAFFTLGDCYITFWNAIILGLMSDSPFLLDSVNYDGAKQTIELFQHEIFLVGSEPNTLKKCWKWIIHPRQKSLVSEERKLEIEKEYLKEKNDSNLHQFQKEMNLITEKSELKQCGYKIIKNQK